MISTKLITARGCNFLFLFKGEWCRPHVDNLLDTNVPEVCNDFSLLKGPLPAEVKALTDTLYLHPNSKPLQRTNVSFELMREVSSRDRLDLASLNVFFLLISYTKILPFLFSLATGAHEILNVVLFTSLEKIFSGLPVGANESTKISDYRFKSPHLS